MNIRLPVECRREGSGAGFIVRTITQNVSTGGMYIELESPDFQVGDRLQLEMTIPPKSGVSPYPGRARCLARVLRVQPIAPASPGAPGHFGIASRFLDRLRLSY